jgi:serine/threonine protein kinase
MQQSSIILFCDECGAANDPSASTCVACQQPLTLAAPLAPPVAPVRITPPVVREVLAGAPVMSASQRLPINLLPGTLLFGRYQIRQEIGRGGFSVVYLAEDLMSGRRPVAIKRIYLHTLTPRQIIDATETCNREIKMLSLLRSVDGVPKFYESFTDPENWYLIMEYIAGQTLEEYMQQAPGGYLPEDKVVEIGKDLTHILQTLHAVGQPGGPSGPSVNQKVIFRDLKPSNIMLTPESKLYLIDFGIARFFTPGQRKDTTPLGSPGYAPPEQYGRAQTDERSDIYSMGMTLQTLLTGRDPLELTQGELSLNPRRASSQFRRLLDKMQESVVDRRPATMKEINKRLTYLQNFGTADKKRVLFSLGVGAALGVLFVGMLFLNFQAYVNGWWFTGSLWIWIAIANWQKRKKLSKRGKRWLPGFATIALGITIILGLVFFLVLHMLGF